MSLPNILYVQSNLPRSCNRLEEFLKRGQQLPVDKNMTLIGTTNEGLVLLLCNIDANIATNIAYIKYINIIEFIFLYAHLHDTSDLFKIRLPVDKNYAKIIFLPHHVALFFRFVRIVFEHTQW